MKKLLSFLGLLVAFLITPVQVFASTLSLSPNPGTFNKSCGFSLAILLDTQGVDTDGTDVILKFEPAKMTATSINKGSLYPDYPDTTIDNNAGRISISGLASVSQAFNGQGTFATVIFQVPSSASTGQTAVTFDFDPNNKAKTTDSNVVQRGTVVDTLTSVTNGNYTIGSDPCSTNSTPAPSGFSGTTGSGTKPGGITGGQGAVGTTASGSAGIAKKVPVETLPNGAISGPTVAIALVGTVLTIIGIVGLVLL